VLDEGRRFLDHLRKVDVIVFAPRGVELREARAVPERMHLQYARIPRAADRLDRPLRMGFEMAALTVALLRTFHRDPVDVLRADDTVVTGLPTVIVGKLLRIPVFVFLAGSIEETVGAKLQGSKATGPTRRFVRWLEGNVVRTADGVLAVNRALASSAQQGGAKLVETTTSFVDVGRFAPRTVDESDDRARASFSIRYLGRLEREKGIFDLLDAVERLARPGTPRIDLEYVGGGSRLAELQEEITRRSLRQWVSIRGPVPHDQVPALLALTDLLVLPSYTEGSPTIVYEAMLAGVPVIATRVGSLPDQFRDGVDILFVETGEPEGLADAIRRLVADAGLRTRLRKEAGVKARDLVARYLPTQLEFIERVLAADASEHS